MKKGFTILELMITIGVILILSGSLLIGWSKGEHIYALQRAAYKLERDIREAQARTMEANEMDCGAGKSSSYGVFFDINSPNEYILFLDCDDSRDWNSGDVLVERIKIEKGIEIWSLSPHVNGVFNILFKPPEPLTYINNNDSGLEGEIVLSLENDFAETRKVRVNTSGCIDIE
jgi:prepilin-type N-terminal cleavage/methylation domain-containing protein